MYDLYKIDLSSDRAPFPETPFLKECELKKIPLSFFHLAAPFEKIGLKTFLSRLEMLLSSKGKVSAYYLIRKGKIVHTALVVPPCRKFPFLGSGDIQIGPCVTEPSYRGKGAYPYVLSKILEEESSVGFAYMMVRESNTPSVKGIEKAGFLKAGKVKKTGFFKRYEKAPEGLLQWRYYKHALIPKTAPHEKVSTKELENGTLWKWFPKGAILARWTEDFDMPNKTPFWYVIKDTPFEIEEVKAKRRYEIRKALKNFDVSVIDPAPYKEDLYRVQVAAYSAYPKKYRPGVDPVSFQKDIESTWCGADNTVIGAFEKESGKLCGYARLVKNENFIHFDSLKTNPEFEKKGVNAALIFQVLQVFDSDLRDASYICDGARNIQHETSFQDYLEKYFGFRKAYCHLRIEYHFMYKALILLLYKMRFVLQKFDGFSLIHKINGILMMEEIVRQQEKKA